MDIKACLFVFVIAKEVNKSGMETARLSPVGTVNRYRPFGTQKFFKKFIAFEYFCEYSALANRYKCKKSSGLKISTSVVFIIEKTFI